MHNDGMLEVSENTLIPKRYWHLKYLGIVFCFGFSKIPLLQFLTVTETALL